MTWLSRVIIMIFFSASSCLASANYPTYSGKELLAGGECIISIIKQSNRFVEILLNVTSSEGNVVHMETVRLLAMAEVNAPQYDFERIQRVDSSSTDGVTQVFNRHHNIRFTDRQRRNMAFRQWLGVEAVNDSTQARTPMNTVNAYVCPRLVRQ